MLDQLQDCDVGSIRRGLSHTLGNAAAALTRVLVGAAIALTVADHVRVCWRPQLDTTRRRTAAIGGSHCEDCRMALTLDTRKCSGQGRLPLRLKTV